MYLKIQRFGAALLCSGLFLVVLMEKQRESNNDQHRHATGNQPDIFPNMTIGRDEFIHDLSGDSVTDDHTRTVGNQRDKSLRIGANFFRGLVIHIDLAGNKEEVVADTVQQNARVEHQCKRHVGGHRKRNRRSALPKQAYQRAAFS